MNFFEKEVRKALIDKEISLKDLSNQLGVCPAYVYDVFKGSRPGKKIKEKIIEILGLNPAILGQNEEAQV